MSQLSIAAGYDRPEVQFKKSESPLRFSCSLPVILGPSRGKSEREELIDQPAYKIKKANFIIFV